jgi:hypothetical protein
MIDGWMVECHVRLRSKCIDHDYNIHASQESDDGTAQLANPVSITFASRRKIFSYKITQHDPATLARCPQH